MSWDTSTDHEFANQAEFYRVNSWVTVKQNPQLALSYSNDSLNFPLKFLSTGMTFLGATYVEISIFPKTVIVSFCLLQNKTLKTSSSCLPKLVLDFKGEQYFSLIYLDYNTQWSHLQLKQLPHITHLSKKHFISSSFLHTHTLA